MYGLATTFDLHATDASVAQIDTDIVRCVTAGVVGVVTPLQEFGDCECFCGIARPYVVPYGPGWRLATASVEERERERES